MSISSSPEPSVRRSLPGDSPRPAWSWADALAAAVPGRRYRIVHVLFGLVRDRCRDLGCEEGMELTCLYADPRTVGFVVEGGRSAKLEREYAWFVEVEAIDPTEGRVN